MTTQPPKRYPTFTLPKRICANKACAKILPQEHKYPYCSWACQQAVKRELEAIEAADKLPQVRPF